VPALKAFAENIGVEGAQWRFVTAPLDYTKEVAARYLLPAGADATAPGGFYHSDKLVLVDRKGRIRGFYSGVDKEAVNKLMEDAASLIAEK
jgi:protein SCO1/2